LLTVYAADFDSTKIQISTPRKLTFTDDMSSPTGWTPDGSAVLIRSNREGTWGIYKQPLAGGPAESIVTKLKGVSWSTPVSPDRKWLIYAYNDGSGSSQPVHIMRVPLSGGPSEEIAKLESGEVRCPVAGDASCVVAETTPDGKHIVFSLFDPMSGKGHELSRFTDQHADELGWDLSPDGAQVSLFRDFASGFQILTLDSAGSVRVVQTENGSQLRNLSWAADGRGFFASAPTQHGAEFVHVDLQGKSRHLWGLTGYNIFLAGRPSPDGRHLAIQGSAATSNIWMIDNF
jgi:Tol biopolymer transport system component